MTRSAALRSGAAPAQPPRPAAAAAHARRRLPPLHPGRRTDTEPGRAPRHAHRREDRPDHDVGQVAGSGCAGRPQERGAPTRPRSRRCSRRSRRCARRSSRSSRRSTALGGPAAGPGAGRPRPDPVADAGLAPPPLSPIRAPQRKSAVLVDDDEARARRRRPSSSAPTFPCARSPTATRRCPRSRRRSRT